MFAHVISKAESKDKNEKRVEWGDKTVVLNWCWIDYIQTNVDE